MNEWMKHWVKTSDIDNIEWFIVRKHKWNIRFHHSKHSIGNADFLPRLVEAWITSFLIKSKVAKTKRCKL